MVLTSVCLPHLAPGSRKLGTLFSIRRRAPLNVLSAPPGLPGTYLPFMLSSLTVETPYSLPMLVQIHPCRLWLWWDWRMERQILCRGWWPRPAIIQGKEVLVVPALTTNLLGQKIISVLSTLEQCGLGASSCSQAPDLPLLPGSREEVS